MRGGLVAEVIRLGLRRVMSAPRLSLVLLTGSLLAVGLAASAPIFIEAVRDLGLRQLLRDADPAEMDLRYIQSGLAATEQSVGEVQNVLAGEAIEASGSLLVGQTTALRTGGYIVRPAAQTLEESDRLHGAFASQTDLEERAELTAGRLPQPDRADGVIEVALERQQAQVFGIAVGDEIIAQPFWLGTPAESRIIVVGIFEPPTDIRSWSTLDVGFLPISARDTELRLWTGRDDILGRLADQSPTLRVALLQRYRLDTSDLAAQSAEVASDRLEIMETRLAQQLPGLAQGSALTSVLVGFRDRFKFAQGTLMMVVLQLVGAVLVYTVIAAAMLAEQRTEDTAWLRSRGARRRDIALLHLVEAAVLTLPAVLLGPLIGMGLVSLLGLVPPFDEALGGGLLPVRLPALAWYVAIGAGALALVAQAIPAYRATGQTIISTRRERGRPPDSWRQRVLVDVAIVALGALLIFELQFSGGPVDTPLVGDTRLEWLAVITPTVLMAVVGLAVLRLFPALMRIAARLATASRWLTPVLGAWYLGRTPTHYARTVLLLAIAGALAVFAGSFRGTLESSYEARALHAAGSQTRLLEPVSEIIAPEDIAAATGRSVAEVQRVSAAFDGDEESGRLQMLALNANIVAALFDDGADAWADTPPLLRALPVEPESTNRAVIDELAGRLVVRLRIEHFQTGTSWAIAARFQDAAGRYWEYVVATIADRSEDEDRLNRAGVTGAITRVDITTDEEGNTTTRVQQGPGGRSAVVATMTETSGPLVVRGEQLQEWNEVGVSLVEPPAFLLAPEGAQEVDGRGRFRPGIKLRPVAPLTLISIDMAGVRGTGSIAVDEIAHDLGGKRRVLEGFDAGHPWQPTPLEVGVEAVDRLSQMPANSAAIGDARGGAVRFSWTREVASLRGLRYAGAQEPLPVLLSETAAEQGRVEIGDLIRIRVGPMPIVFRVAGVFEHFPTWDPGIDPGLLVVDRDALFARIFSSAAAGTSLPVLDELWVDAPLHEFVDLVEAAEVPLDSLEIITVESARAEIEADPLLVAAWNGVFIGALAAVAVAASFGLVVLMSVTAQARRIEFAVCQSIGMSVRQVLGLIAIEQIAVIIVGLGAGVLVGTQAGHVLLDFFALTPDGRDVVPPLQFLVDWKTVGIQFGALIALFAVNLSAFLIFLRRIELHGALRLAA